MFLEMACRFGGLCEFFEVLLMGLLELLGFLGKEGLGLGMEGYCVLEEGLDCWW